MLSFPNLIPLDQATVLEIARRAGRFTNRPVYGAWGTYESSMPAIALDFARGQIMA